MPKKFFAQWYWVLCSSRIAKETKSTIYKINFINIFSIKLKYVFRKFTPCISPVDTTKMKYMTIDYYLNFHSNRFPRMKAKHSSHFHLLFCYIKWSNFKNPFKINDKSKRLYNDHQHPLSCCELWYHDFPEFNVVT